MYSDVNWSVFEGGSSRLKKVEKQIEMSTEDLYEMNFDVLAGGGEIRSELQVGTTDKKKDVREELD